MKESEKPEMDWDSTKEFSEDVVWWGRLDRRYQIEIHRKGERVGQMLIWDHDDNDRFMHEEEVVLAYAAIFGPDILDVIDWQNKATEIIDKLNNKK